MKQLSFIFSLFAVGWMYANEFWVLFWIVITLNCSALLLEVISYVDKEIIKRSVWNHPNKRWISPEDVQRDIDLIEKKLRKEAEKDA